MKKTYLIVFCLFTLFSCKSQSNSEIVVEFINSYNKKDSITTFRILHNDFAELWKKDTVILGKSGYYKNYSWGKIMNDREEIEIIKIDSNTVETISTYYSDRDKLLNISPYKSKRVYEIQTNQIIKITGQEFKGYKEYDEPRRTDYELFFCWLKKAHNLKPSEIPYDKNGSEKLKKLILEYNKTDKDIYKVIGQEFKNYKKKYYPRRDLYSLFLNWMYDNHKLKVSDIDNTKKEIQKVKGLIREYQEIK